MMINRVLIACCILFILPMALFAQEEKKTKDDPDVLYLDWPFDQESGFHNYAQELVFDKEKGNYHLNRAWEYYRKGIELVKPYEFHDDVYDWFQRDAYTIEVLSPYGRGMRMDFTIAEAWFLKALDIIAYYIEWDEQMSSKPEYKKLVKNTFNNLIYTSVFNGRFSQAYDYIQVYKNFNPDPDFIDEWES
ncbi:MAG: hypothetical protein KKH98_13805, partial [Spirochaetes bacterium]|nr:hypothetical protein [Spirochaetota bacterium]